MPVNPLTHLGPWRRTAVVAAIVPLLIAVVLTAFAWTAARSAPRDLLVGVVAAAPMAGRVTAGLQAGGFDVHDYPDRTAATDAIEHRDVYAAIVVRADRSTVLTASAAAPSVATQFAAMAGTLVPGRVEVIDVVPLSATDPRGAVLASAALPLVFGGMLAAMLVALLLGLPTAWRTLSALVIVSATTGLAVYLVIQGWLGALPGEHVRTWAAVSATILAISSIVAGLYKLLGTAGIGVGAALVLFVGNPFSGITSAPELLPSAVGTIGRWLPPGAGVNLLRSTAYFDGHGAAGHLAVLICWAALGMTAVVVGHARHARHARHTRRAAAQRPAAARGRHEIGAGHIPIGRFATTSLEASCLT